MLKPFSKDILTGLLDMFTLSALVDQNLTEEHVNSGPLKSQLAAVLVNLVRQNVTVTELAAAEHLRLPDMNEVKMVTKKGTMFGVITGGKGL
jgi:hypothetical protein